MPLRAIDIGIADILRAASKALTISRERSGENASQW